MRGRNNVVDKVWRPKEKDTALSKPQDPPPKTSRSKPRQASNAAKSTKRSQPRGDDEANYSRREKRQHPAGDSSYDYDEDYEKSSRGRGAQSSNRKTKRKDSPPQHTTSEKRHAEPARSQKKPRRERDRRSDGRSRRVSTDHDTQRSRRIDHDNQDDREHPTNRHQANDRTYENEDPNQNLAQSQSRSDRNNTRRRNDSGRDRDRPKNVTSPQQRKRRDRQRDGSRRSYGYVAFGESGFSHEHQYRNRTHDSQYDEYSYENESRNSRPARRRGNRQRRFHPQYDEQPVEFDHLPQDKEDVPSRDSQRQPEPSKTPSQRVESVEMKDSAPPSHSSPQQSQETPAQDPTSPTRPKQEPTRSGVFVSPPRTTGDTPNGFDHENGATANGNVENHANQSASPLRNVEDAEAKEEANAIFSLDDLGRLLNAFDIVLDGLQKMRQNDLAAQMKSYRDQLANSLDHKAVPQSLDAFQEVSSMARSNDGGDFSQDAREGPTKPPLRKLRRTLPQVNAPRGLSGAGPRRKPPKVTTAANSFRGFELFGPAAWGYDSYHLTSQETSDVSISPDVGYYQKNDAKQETKSNQHATPSSTSTAMNTEISRLNPTAKAETPSRLASPQNGFAQQQPAFQQNYGRAPNGMFPSRGSYGDLQMAPMHTPYMPTNPFSASGTLSGTQTGVTTAQPTPPSSVPTFSTPNVFTDGRVPTVPMMFPAAPHYMSASGPMRIPVMNVAQETYNSQPNAMLRTPSASSVPDQPRAPLMRPGDGSFDPNRHFRLKLLVSLPTGEKNELYFYEGDNSRDVARMFCARHNMLNHSGLVENEINKLLTRDSRF